MENDWIYRYREFNAITLKELLYQEIYFSSQEELNDPLDYEFILTVNKGQPYIHEFFVEPALHDYKSTKYLKNKILKIISNFLSSHYVSLNEIECFILNDYIAKELIKYTKDELIAKHLQQRIINSYRNILPVNLQSVSFSKTCTNPLLWTHYAKAHTGFCIVFKPEKRLLNIKKINDKKYSQFKCSDVRYGSEIEIDLSLMFDKQAKFNWQNVVNHFLVEVQRKALLTKHKSHSKEKEIRIFGNYGTSYSVEPIPETKIIKSENIHYFDPNQFVGIVFGFKMKEDEKKEILYILDKNKDYKSFKIFQCIKIKNTVETVLINNTNRL